MLTPKILIPSNQAAPIPSNQAAPTTCGNVAQVRINLNTYIHVSSEGIVHPPHNVLDILLCPEMQIGYEKQKHKQGEL